MEDALALTESDFEAVKASGLNPCFNGRCTRTGWKYSHRAYNPVLILVLMEDALVQMLTPLEVANFNSLNPCFNGRCTRTRS